MIVTLTANPSLDRTVALTGPLVRGAVHRAAATRVDPGGKGVNVARVLRAAGRPVLAVLPGNTGDPLLAALDDHGIGYRAVPTGGFARSNITVAEPDGTTTKLNEPGPAYTEGTLDALRRTVVDAAADARWVVMSGSLPPGVPADWYADLVRSVRAAAVDGSVACRIAVDTSESPLLSLAARFPDAAPDLLKPNSDELAQLTGADAAALESAAAAGDTGPVVAAGRRLVERGVGAVLATLGAAGAVLITAEGAWHAVPGPVTARSTVGAGDSSLAGYLVAELAGLGPAERLRHAVAYGSAAVALPGTTLPGPDDVDTGAVEVAPLRPVPLDTPSPALPHHQ
ncbi:1-phosphofructokinase [Rhodococcus sp. WB1]|uniref:1-phosphofructokinase family hexose kinase n=4 Tax=Rhodococcus TaxID=1827 RepID=A0AA46NT92_9NOCA|nr:MULTISPECIES: 1-phosphofructokinase family hexose kinase [Rhodococcus]ANZ25440.1 1-phosphofructokinase [Rhodococcus sp. WB1]OLL17574.1 1-phosphofructokinase [Rhodococcus sp. M8]QPG45847.1 1-phosphofructokinase family hexose kinase [Rhodococcus sp. M8]UGQ44102.1 1-phosphofructokinase family hexose kinase [Rhodococcus aetherivorans]USC17724.1 1-phosphofructokinase family hexose kinase [Rhodococcus sp. 11-3]